AARVAVFGVQSVAACVGDQLRLLTVGRRLAPPRHKTITAVLDWSYQLLSREEQTVLRRLAVFVGGFTLQAAAAIAADADGTVTDVADRIASLVPKSLVAVDEVAPVSGSGCSRSRGHTRSRSSGRAASADGPHAAMPSTTGIFSSAPKERCPARTAGEWLADYAPEIDNLRAGLDWAFSPGGDGAIGVALTGGGVPLWMGLSLLEECHSRSKQALGALRAGGIRDSREEMRLNAALGASATESREMGAAFTTSLEIAESLGDLEYQL